jgi:AFG3 family protein
MSNSPQNFDNNSGNNPNNNAEQPNKFGQYWIYALILAAIVIMNFIPFRPPIKEISQQQFFQEFMPSQEVEKIIVVNKTYVEVYIKPDKLKGNPKYTDIAESKWTGVNKGPHFYFTIGSIDAFAQELQVKQKELPQAIVDTRYEQRADWQAGFFTYILPILFIVGIWIFIMRRLSNGMGGPGGQIFNFGKSKAALFDGEGRVNITFEDVAGLDEAKEEVREVVEFLKTPEKYQSLGGKIPKGVLLIGPPGTGKTLLGKAMAGEAKVPFFSLSGSDFVEMFVGVGASRVRDLFKQARDKAPCIIFIDEIDAIGRARGRNTIQSNDERENTLNALLVEMDGFASDKAVIILAATNRPDVLDSALMRPGRFDRQISIDKPDLVGREQIFKVHLKTIKTATNLDLKKLAGQTPGFAGADIANVCNEAALIAARRDKLAVDINDFQDAIDRVIGGLEKKNKIISPQEKEIIAYHEAGHAIAGWFLQYAYPLLKVTIVPRGVAALGYAQYLPKEQYLYTIEQLTDQMCMTLGGRVAEDIIFGRISTGAQNDLERITKMAYAMVTVYGMNDKVGNVSFHDNESEYSFQKPYSEATSRMIDEEVRNIINNAYNRTKQLLQSKRRELETIAQALLKKEILHKDDLDALIGKRPFEDMELHALSSVAALHTIIN